MPRIHILTGNGGNEFSCVVHAPTPAGNNSAGISWATALKNAGFQGASVMPIGTGAGQITTAESNSVVAGTILEAQFSFTDNPNWTGPERTAALNAQADVQVAQLQAIYSARLK